MKTLRQHVGQEGEIFAARYLVGLGWKILGVNIHLPWNDEIDILAHDEDRVLVFVEVKTVSGDFVKPEDQMTQAKIKKCIRAAQWYANQHQELITSRAGWRIDCLALQKNGGSYEVRHYQQIV